MIRYSFLFDEQVRSATILFLIGRNVVSDSRGRKEEEGTKTTRVRTKHVIGWNSTVLHPVLHPRLLDTIVFHRYLPSSVSNQQPLVALSSHPLHWQPYERIYSRDVEIFSSRATDFPVSQTLLTRVYARPEITDKLDGIKFLPLEKNRRRKEIRRWNILENPAETLLYRKLSDHWNSFHLG